MNRAFMMGVVAGCFAVCLPAGGAPPEPRTFEAVRKLHDEALKADEFRVERPRRQLISEDGKKTERIYTGRVIDEYELVDFAEREAFLELARLRNLRVLKLGEGERAADRDRVYDQAEARLAKIPTNSLKRSESAAARRQLWAEVYDYHRAAAARRGNGFDGFHTVPDVAGWDSLSGTPSPFDRMHGHYTQRTVKLVGPAGHTVEFMKAFSFRLQRGKDPKDWVWESTYNLDPSNPPRGFFADGQRYYYRVRAGTRVGEALPKTIDETTPEISFNPLN